MRQPLLSPFLRLVLLVVFCALWGVFSGCACGAPALQTQAPGVAPKQGGSKEAPAPQETKVVSKEYLIRGVATLTFYPDHANTAIYGALGGYTMFFSKPQKASLQFASMADDTCELGKARYNRNKPDYKGLDSGEQLTLALKPYDWQLPLTPLNAADPDLGSYYPVPSVEKMAYPYDTTLTIKSKGGKDIGPVALQLTTPSRLQILSPTVILAGTKLSREEGIPLKWRFEGKVPYLSVRINQKDPVKESVTTLSCRFANDGEASITPAQLKPFAKDPTGQNTHIYFFSGNYQFFKLPDYDEPIMAVIEAITHATVLF